MNCILSLKDCGVTDSPLKEEPPRASLIREIYTFLDCSVSFPFVILSIIVLDLLNDLWKQIDLRTITLYFFFFSSVL